MIDADEAGASTRRTRRAFDEAKHGRMIDYFNGLVDVTSAVLPLTVPAHATVPTLGMPFPVLSSGCSGGAVPYALTYAWKVCVVAGVCACVRACVHVRVFVHVCLHARMHA